MSAFHCESWFTGSKIASSGCLSVILSPSNTKVVMLQVDKFPTLPFERLADIINQSFNVKTLRLYLATLHHHPTDNPMYLSFMQAFKLQL
jgi:hypothetical protein